MKINIDDLIVKNQSKQENENKEISQFNLNENEKLTKLCEENGLKTDIIENYLKENKLTLDEFKEKLETNKLILGITENEISTLATNEEEDKETLLGPFNVKNGVKDEINLNTGALIYTDNAVSIPGRNGLDLNITYRYNSSNKFDGNTNTQFMGAGWTDGFTKITEHEGKNIYKIQFGDGTEYKVQRVVGTEYELKNYPYDDIKIKADIDSTVKDSYFIITYSNGKKEYFNLYGNLIAIKDRYNNAITIDSWNETTTITDTNNRKVIIVNEVKSETETTKTIILPNSKKIIYTYQLKKAPGSREPLYIWILTKKNYDGLITKFEYAPQYSSIKKKLTCEMTSITVPTGLKSKYTYESAKMFGGYYKRLTSREYNDGQKSYNKETYTYSNTNYTGYIPDGGIGDNKYEYYICVKDGKGLETKYIFNEYNLNTKVIKTNTSVSSKPVEEEITNEYQVVKTVNSVRIYNPNPIKKTTTRWSLTTVELYEYDYNGRLIAYWSPLANGSKTNVNYKTTYKYDSTYGILYSKSYKKDASTTMEEYNTLDATKKNILSSEIKENGVMKEKTNYSYDTYGNVISERKVNGSSYIETKMTYVNNYTNLGSIERVGISKVSYTYDTMGNVISETDGNKNITRYAYDGKNNLIQTTYPNGAIVKRQYNYVNNTMNIIDERGNNLLYVYDKLGNLKEVKDTKQNNLVLKSCEYDSFMRLTKQIDLINKNTPTRAETLYTYDILSRITSKTIKNSVALYTENYSYANSYVGDSITKTIKGDANSSAITIRTEYDKIGQLLKETNYNIVKVYTYDFVGNKISENISGNTTTYTYDCVGRVLIEKDPYGKIITNKYNMLGDLIEQKDKNGNITQYKYDNGGRVTECSSPLVSAQIRSVVGYKYDGNGNLIQESVRNSAPNAAVTARVTDYRYDNMNNQISASTGGLATTYNYDKSGNVIKVIPPIADRTVSYEYDSKNRLTKIIYPKQNTTDNNNTEVYTYDDAGNVATKKDRNGNTIYYVYDALNRLTTETVNGKKKQYQYTVTGPMSLSSNQNTSTTYKYNQIGKIWIQTNKINGRDYKMTYNYDNKGNIETISCVYGGKDIYGVKYEYDKLNRLAKVYEGTTSLKMVAEYTYDANGNRKTLKYPNSVTTTYDYNLGNLVTKVENKKGTQLLSRYNYDYYCDGNVMSKLDNTGRKITYKYDNFGRLANENETLSNNKVSERQYIYDKVGNRTEFKESEISKPYTMEYTYKYDVNNRLTEMKKAKIERLDTREQSGYTYTYYYDNNGNELGNDFEFWMQAGIAGRSAKQNFNYIRQSDIKKYDEYNQVIQFEDNTRYTYSPEGLRLSKEINGGGKYYLYNGQNLLIEIDDMGAITSYIRGTELIKNSSNNYYVYNGHGDVTQVTDSVGNIINNYDYNSFGVPSNISSTDKNPWRYCGEYYDTESDTIYLRNRYYNPDTGRFITQDPIRSGLNWYTYCNNNPLSFIDPTGLERIAISGSEYDDKTRYKYNFIESALKQINDWLISDAEAKINSGNPSLETETITWIISKTGYSDKAIKNFNDFGKAYGINIVYIQNSSELYNYINSKNVNDSYLSTQRTDDKITQFSLFSHGLVRRVALGYQQENANDLVMTIDNISINQKAFDNVINTFYSCNTGTGMEDSFAQAWSNATGGSSKAVVTGTTTYSNMNVGESIFDKLTRRIKGFNYRTQYYPQASEGVSWHVFYPNI